MRRTALSTIFEPAFAEEGKEDLVRRLHPLAPFLLLLLPSSASSFSTSPLSTSSSFYNYSFLPSSL
jgi:hypothetical protein